MSNKYYTLVILGLMIIVKYLFFSPKLSFRWPLISSSIPLLVISTD